MPSVSCFNRGCGQQYDPENNGQEACCHHPGMPFFHDAYKGWSCCNKKSVDFTEFLNIKGCTLSQHSNVKPPEPPKPIVDKDSAHIPIEVKPREPIVKSTLERPPFNSTMTTLVPIIAPSLKQKIDHCPHKNTNHAPDSDELVVGTKCKNGGCRGEYQGPESNSEDCVHHPGSPVFHEGMKYWTCCNKKTTDFSTFLNQVGCTIGLHKWKKESVPSNIVRCRWDWHQTGNFVVVAVYAKDYDFNASVVKINPIRLFVELDFPKENNAKFTMDIELRGVIDAKESNVEMFGTKVEIKLRKAELGSWSKLNFPREAPAAEPSKEKEEPKKEEPTADENDEDVDLDDVEPVVEIGKVNITEITD